MEQQRPAYPWSKWRDRPVLALGWMDAYSQRPHRNITKEARKEMEALLHRHHRAWSPPQRCRALVSLLRLYASLRLPKQASDMLHQHYRSTDREHLKEAYPLVLEAHAQYLREIYEEKPVYKEEQDEQVTFPDNSNSF